MELIKFIKCNENAVKPRYNNESDAGLDVCSVEDVVLQAGEFRVVKTGLQCEIPAHLEIQVRPRSGLAAKHGITVLNTPGTVDAGFRGEIGVILINHSKVPFAIEKGMRIAQFVIATVTKAEFIEAEEISASDRGEKGFGSSGLKN